MRKHLKSEYIYLYFVLVLIFRYLFVLIPPLFITDLNKTPYVIDTDVFERWAILNTDYIETAKGTYNRKFYMQIYLPLDMVFPIVYSLLFGSIAYLVITIPKLYKWIGYLIIAGAIADYAENLMFTWLLYNSSNAFALTVAICSAIKTGLFIINGLTAIIILAVLGLLKLFALLTRAA